MGFIFRNRLSKMSRVDRRIDLFLVVNEYLKIWIENVEGLDYKQSIYLPLEISTSCKRPIKTNFHVCSEK
jgi:hypothetical protein